MLFHLLCIIVVHICVIVLEEEISFSMFVKWSFSYIHIIGWLNWYLLRSILFPILKNNVANMFLIVLYDVIYCLYAIIILFLFSSLFDCFLTYFDLYVVAFDLKYFSRYVYGWFIRSIVFVYLCNDLYLMSSTLVDWWFTSLYLYVISFHLDFFRKDVLCCYSKKCIFVSLWLDQYPHLVHRLIDCIFI